MKSSIIALMSAFLLLLVATAGSATSGPKVWSEGPYHGVVFEGKTDVHAYLPPPRECIVPPAYYVTLTYSPGSDELLLSAHGESDLGEDGYAQVVFDGSCSESFAISVTGVDVDTVASYTVTVKTGPRLSSS